MRLQMLRDAPQHGVPLQIFDTQTRKGLGVRAQRERKMKDALGDELSRTLCAVCLTRPKTSLFLPCKHLCACGECAARIMRPPPDAKGVRREPQCPICRVVPSQVLDVYA